MDADVCMKPEDGGSDNESDGQMLTESSRVLSQRDSKNDTPTTSRLSEKIESGNVENEVEEDRETESVKISSFSEIDKNEEVPSSLDYKSSTNFTHGKIFYFFV